MIDRSITTPSDPPNGKVAGERFDVHLKVIENSPSESATEVSACEYRRSILTHIAILGTVLLIAGTFVGLRIKNGWVPADEGTLGQSALRVLSGQLPHRDFAEIYTGGLSLLHAVAFHVLGVNLVSLRICVFVLFLAWVPTLYYIALRFTSPSVAGLVTLLAAAWSFPNYPAAMPSWYNLFFATFGAAALLRFLEIKNRRWLFIAGVCGGISILIKIIGVYYVAGCLLFLTFLEQRSHRAGSLRQPAIAYRLFTTSALAAYLVVLISLMRTRLGAGELYHLQLPSLFVVGTIVFSEVGVGARSRDRFQSLFGSTLPFLAGVIAPIAVFLVPYAYSRSVGSFFSGVVSSATSRSVALGVIRPLGMGKSIYGLALAGLIACTMFLREFQGKVVGAAAGLGFVAIMFTMTQSIVTAVWLSMATVTPIVVLAGTGFLIARRKDDRTTLQQENIMLLMSLAATCTLVQYPFSAPIYLLYSLPLTLLAAVGIVASARKQSGTYILIGLVLFLTSVAAVGVVPQNIYELTHVVREMSVLQLERAGGLRVENARSWKALIGFLRVHSPNGLMYAGNNCPELYFLSGLKNITRNDGGATPDEVLRALQSENLKLVVINEVPYFVSARTSLEMKAEVAKRFPESARFGIYQVFWRE